MTTPTSSFDRMALLATGSAAFAMMGAGLSLYGPAVLSFERLFELTTAEASRVIAAHWVGSLSGVLAMFLFPERIGPRPGLVALALGAVLLGAGLGWTATLLGAAVLGLGYGALTAVFNPRILSAFGVRGPAMLSLINAVFSLGAILAPFAFSLIAERPERLFILMGLLTLVVAAGAGPAGRVRAEDPGQGGGGFRLNLPILVFGAMGIGLEVAFAGLGPAALVRAGEDEATAARLLSAFYVAFLAGRVVLIFTAHRIAAFTIYVLGMVLAALALLGAALVDPGFFFPPLGLAAGLFFPGYYVTGSALLGRDPRVSPFLIGIAQIGAMGLPLILAIAVDPFGPRGFFWVTGGLAGALAALSLLAWPAMRKAGSG